MRSMYTIRRWQMISILDESLLSSSPLSQICVTLTLSSLWARILSNRLLGFENECVSSVKSKEKMFSRRLKCMLYLLLMNVSGIIYCVRQICGYDRSQYMMISGSYSEIDERGIFSSSMSGIMIEYIR